MKFVINYGCGCGDNEEVIEAKDLEAAERYAYECAINNYESYEGLHGVMSIDDVCEDHDIEDRDSEEAWIAYTEERESQISYSVEKFDSNNEEHIDLLEYSGCHEI